MYLCCRIIQRTLVIMKLKLSFLLLIIYLILSVEMRQIKVNTFLLLGLTFIIRFVFSLVNIRSFLVLYCRVTLVIKILFFHTYFETSESSSRTILIDNVLMHLLFEYSEAQNSCKMVFSSEANAVSLCSESDIGANLSSEVSAIYLAMKNSKLECVDEYGQDSASANVYEEDEEDFDDFDPFYFIQTLPDLSSVVPQFRHSLLPKQTRSCPATTLVLDLDGKWLLSVGPLFYLKYVRVLW